MESYLGIGELARASGLPVSALRFYDGAGVLVPAAVDPSSGYRRYAPAQVRDARLVARLRRVGMPLAAVRALLGGAPPGPLLDAHLARLESGLADARRELSAVLALLSPEVPVRLTLPAPALAAALDAVRPAVGTDPSYPFLSGILLERDDAVLYAVASDRYRIAVGTVPCPAGDPVRVLLPTPLADAARPLLTSGDAVLTVDGDQVGLTAGGRSVSGPAGPDGFPDWRRLDPGGRPHRVPLDVAAFRAELAAGPVEQVLDAGPTVVLTVGPDGGLTVGGAGDGLRIGVNRDFLLDALARHDQLTLELDGPITPLAVRAPDGWSLLMPVRLDAA